MVSVPALELRQLSDAGECDVDLMPWTKPQHGPSRVTAAGKIISARKQPNEDLDMETALWIAGNWRSAHGYPLHVFKQLLRGRAKQVDKRALVAQRLKRLPSIITKLQRFHSMQLSTMQDLGGCRAVVRRVSNVDALVRMYENVPTNAAKFVSKKDYISEPKSDGYRSVHLVYEYQGHSQEGAFRGLLIEIQLRSRLQHAWATALETIDTFTDEALKSGLGDESWKRFFALMATAIAMEEKRPHVANTPEDLGELKKELKPLCQKLKVPDVFDGLSMGLRMLTTKIPKGVVAYILILDTDAKTTGAEGFVSFQDASDRYLEMERENLNKPHMQTVLVSVDSLASLKKAYPSYYLDAEAFTQLIGHLIG
jgi:ppGpp synthetase/RelA/SpoT-type nucleotidyltranferase